MDVRLVIAVVSLQTALFVVYAVSLLFFLWSKFLKKLKEQESDAQIHFEDYINELMESYCALESEVKGVRVEFEEKLKMKPLTPASKPLIKTAIYLNRSNRRRNISPSTRFNIMKRDGFKCKICGRSADKDNATLEIDHRVPVSRGGTNAPENLWTLCDVCNGGKSNKEL